MATSEYVVDFPTLWVAADWIEAHCVVPDRFQAGAPFEQYEWQLWCLANHYRVKRTAVWRPESPMLSTAFHYRRSQIVAPQKIGKGPWTACICALEAAGPALFRGWASGGEVYDCADNGCGCGWTYEYRADEPMGMRWPTPLIQITATSEDQTANIYRPLQNMIRLGPLGDLMRAGEEFVRVGLDGRIDVVTSSAQSRLGNPVTFPMQDETGTWTATNRMTKVADTQRRGAAGMGGRSMETTNPWDPSEQSVAQLTAESPSRDIFRFHRMPPKGLKYTVKADRRKIHRFVYAGSRHIDLDAIEGEAAELIERDPQQAERFFGNRVVYGAGSWADGEKWDARAARREVPDGVPIVLGFDGSDVNDWTGIRAELQDGYQFTPTFGPDNKPTIWNPAEHDGQVPRLEVAAAIDELMSRYKVIRMYADPPDWKSELDDWSAKYGDKVVIRWETYRAVQMHAASERLLTDIGKVDSAFSHDGCPITAVHIKNARKVARPGKRYVLAKPNDSQKIDLAVTSIICHEAAGDVTAAKLWLGPQRLTRVTGRASGY